MPKNQKSDPEGDKKGSGPDTPEPTPVESEKSYYYDDAHGYEDYVEDEEGSEMKDEGSSLRSQR